MKTTSREILNTFHNTYAHKNVWQCGDALENMVRDVIHNETRCVQGVKCYDKTGAEYVALYKEVVPAGFYNAQMQVFVKPQVVIKSVDILGDEYLEFVEA